MPRQARLDTFGALHHIMVRGINRSRIFRDEEDKRRFLKRLGEAVKKGECSVYAWVLMDNHVQILFKSGRQGISTVMRRVLTWYAQDFNRRHRRRGHLFENRYKSVLCDEENYLLALVRYIHLNPVRARVVSTLRELDRYPWSGHGALMGREDHPWMDIGYVLSRFGGKRETAVRGYRKFVEEGMGMGRVKELTGGGLIRSLGGWSQVVSMRRRGGGEESDERILGIGEFVEGILREVEERQLRQIRLRRRGVGIQEIIAEECGKMGVNSKELMQGGRRGLVSRVREAVAYRCGEELGMAAAEIARHVGVVTSSVGRAIARERGRRGK
jgi:putative transposase